jgi:hypothetical protein
MNDGRSNKALLNSMLDAGQQCSGRVNRRTTLLRSFFFGVMHNSYDTIQS